MSFVISYASILLTEMQIHHFLTQICQVVSVLGLLCDRLTTFSLRINYNIARTQLHKLSPRRSTAFAAAVTGLSFYIYPERLSRDGEGRGPCFGNPSSIFPVTFRTWEEFQPKDLSSVCERLIVVKKGFLGSCDVTQMLPSCVTEKGEHSRGETGKEWENT